MNKHINKNKKPKGKSKVLIPYDYQDKAHKRVVEYSLIFREMLLALTAGGGKTFISQLIYELLRKEYGEDYQVAFISPMKTITTQTKKYFPNCGFYQSGSRKQRPALGSSMTLYTMKTFINMHIEKPPKRKNSKKPVPELVPIRAKFIIIDEVQMLVPAVKAIQKKIKDENLDIKLLFLTATPYDGQGFLLPIVEKAKMILPWKYANARFYIQNGYLLPMVLKQVAKTPIDKDKLNARENEHGQIEFSEENHKEAVKNSIDVAKSMDEPLKRLGGQVIVLASNIEHANKLTKDFIELGYSARAMHSKGTELDKNSKKVLDDFKAGLFQIIVSVRMITVGTDMPNAIHLVIATMIASLAYYVQACARPCRLGGGTIAYIWDFMGNAERLGSPLQMVIPKDLSEKKESKKQICELCKEEYVNKNIDTWVEDGTKWSVLKRSCCGFEEMRGQELPSVVCTNEECNHSFIVEQTIRINNDIIAVCPDCKTNVLVETITPAELITLVQDREEFVLQLATIVKESLTPSKLEIFKKWVSVYTAFSTQDVLRGQLDSLLGLSDGIRNYDELETIVSDAKSLSKKYPMMMRFFKEKEFDLNSFSETIEAIQEATTLMPKTYLSQLRGALNKWGFTNGLKVDFKRLNTNVKRNITLEKKKYNIVIEEFRENDSGRCKVMKDTGDLGDCVVRAFTHMSKLQYKRTFDVAKRILGYSPKKGVHVEGVIKLAEHFDCKTLEMDMRELDKSRLIGYEYCILFPKHLAFINSFGTRLDTHNEGDEDEVLALIVHDSDSKEIVKELDILSR